MVLSEACLFSDSQEIPRILWNPTVLYCAHESSPPVPMVNKTSPVHSCPISLKYVLILSPHLRLVLPNSLFPSGFHTLLCTHLSCPPYALHACTRHSYSVNYPNIRRGTQVMKLLVTQCKTRTVPVYVTV